MQRCFVLSLKSHDFWGSAMGKNLLMPLFLMGCFPGDFREGKRPIKAKSGKRPIKVGKRPIKEGKRPFKAMVLVGISVGCSMGCFRASPPWRKTAPLKRPIEGSSASPKPHPSKSHPCNMPQAKTEVERCSFRNAALQKLHCNIGFSAVRMSFWPKAALQQAKNCSATLRKLRCRKVALSYRFPADFKLPRLGTHV